MSASFILVAEDDFGYEEDTIGECGYYLQTDEEMNPLIVISGTASYTNGGPNPPCGESGDSSEAVDFIFGLTAFLDCDGVGTVTVGVSGPGPNTSRSVAITLDGFNDPSSNSDADSGTVGICEQSTDLSATITLYDT